MTDYRKIWVDGHRVYELAQSDGLCFYAMRTSLVPIGLAFRAHSDGWAVLDFIPWGAVSAFEREEPDMLAAPGLNPGSA